MKKLVLLLIIFCLFIPLSPKAKMELNNRHEVFSFLKEAFQAQVALSENERSKDEINKILNPYFTEQFQQVFWKENVVEQNGKFITYGSDFAKYYIPFYQYSNKTKVVIHSDKVYVIEYFPESTEGPVGYKSHYEGILIENISGEWKISKYLYNHIPEKIIKESIKGKVDKHR